MSGKVVGWAFDRGEDLSPAQRFVLVAIADNADHEGRAWPSKKELARKTGYGLATIYRAIKELEELGLFEERVEKGREFFYLAVSENPPGHSQSEKADSQSEKPFSQSENGFSQSEKSTNKEPSENRQGNRQEKPSSPSGSEVEELCKLQLDLATARTNGSKRLKVTDGWRAEMSRLIRIDGRTPEQIEYVIRWVDQDSFWAANVLSVPKLREQFDKLVAKITEDAKVRRNGKRGVGPSSDDLRAMAAKLKSEGR